jgi:hypothetical protein
MTKANPAYHKRDLYSDGVVMTLQDITQGKSSRESPEIIAFATEQYHGFVKRGILKPERKLRKASQ